MGYAVGSLVHLGQILRTTQTTGKHVIDLGSQDVTIFDDSDAQNLRRFVEEFGGDPNALNAKLKASFPIIMSAAEIFSAAGFDYHCCDVDRRQGTVYVDFNTLAFNQSLYGQFDLVLNAGTTEHLPNPLAAFFFMHYLCRKNGLLYNEVPLSGWFNHGLNNLTPKFWHTLRWMNSYKVVSAIIKPVGVTQNEGDFGGKHLDFIEHLSDLEQQSASIQIIFQKVEDRGFVPPYDAVLPEGVDGKPVADLVWASLLPFVAGGSLSPAAAAGTVNSFLSLQNQRIMPLGETGAEITAIFGEEKSRRLSSRDLQRGFGLHRVTSEYSSIDRRGSAASTKPLPIGYRFLSRVVGVLQRSLMRGVLRASRMHKPDRAVG